MTEEKVKKSQELLKLIQVTQEGISNLNRIIPKRRKETEKRGFDRVRTDIDSVYNLCISEHEDGSGDKAQLHRYFGNEALLTVIISTLEGQLADFQKQFDEL